MIHKVLMLLMCLSFFNAQYAGFGATLIKTSYAIGQTMKTKVLPMVAQRSKQATVYTYHKLVQAGKFTANKVENFYNKMNKKETKKNGAPRRS